MRGFIATVLVVVFCVFGFFALTGRPMPDLGLGKFVGNAEESTDLTGKWTTRDTNPRMTAEIVDDKITVNMISPEAHLIYWYGSYTEPTHGSFVSNAIKLDILVLSTLSTKEFSYEDGKISFRMTISGVTKNVVMERQ